MEEKAKSQGLEVDWDLLYTANNSSMNSTRTTFYLFLIVISIASLILVSAIGLRYSYNSYSIFESCMGFLSLAAVAGSLWYYRNRARQLAYSPERNASNRLGFVLGMLWAIEISINNFIAPALPARDIIDNIFWTVIGASILIFSSAYAYQKDSLVRGIEMGTWSGFVSGLLACCMGLIVIVFGMHFILQDPLNLSEWAGRGTGTNTPSMAAYFAFETLAGAFGHLFILGVGMGGLLGILGGSIGKGIKRIIRLMQKS